MRSDRKKIQSAQIRPLKLLAQVFDFFLLYNADYQTKTIQTVLELHKTIRIHGTVKTYHGFEKSGSSERKVQWLKHDRFTLVAHFFDSAEGIAYQKLGNELHWKH